MNHSALVFVLLSSLLQGVAQANTTSREQQSVIARWTGENICKMGTERFYALPEDDVRKLFESQTSMRYNDIPLEKEIKNTKTKNKKNQEKRKNKQKKE
jgi:hypothetical protein